MKSEHDELNSIVMRDLFIPFLSLCFIVAMVIFCYYLVTCC
jgi:hypothetical protein